MTWCGRSSITCAPCSTATGWQPEAKRPQPDGEHAWRKNSAKTGNGTMPRERHDEPFYLIVTDKDNETFSVEGPMN
jgi:hypothetical protein